MRMLVGHLREIIIESERQKGVSFFYGCQRYPSCDATAQGQRPHRLAGTAVKAFNLSGQPASLGVKGRPVCPVCKLPMRKMVRSLPQKKEAGQGQQASKPMQAPEHSERQSQSKQPSVEPPITLVQLVDGIKARDLRYFDEAALQKLSRTFKVPDWQMFRWLRALGLEPRQQELF